MMELSAAESMERIAILGAGPIGIEAALYARFLGYRVELIERGEVADNVRRWGHVRMFSPFAALRSTLGMAALTAQDGRYTPPSDDALLTGNRWADEYLEPLARTDLLADCLKEKTKVVSVARTELLKQDLPNKPGRADSAFRVLVEDREGHQSDTEADIVIDCTGVFANPNWMGQGGAPAIGESDCRDRIDYNVPDLLGSDRDRFQGRKVLVVGSGHSAATSIVAFAEIQKRTPATNVTWVTRRSPKNGGGPVLAVAGDPLRERARLTTEANRQASDGGIAHWPGTTIQAVTYDHDRQSFQVTFAGNHEGVENFDRIIANVGFRPDSQLYGELQVHECYASGGPMRLAAALLGNDSTNCLDQTCQGPQSLINPEPDFYILGAKSYGRNPNFLVSVGIGQVRELFTLIGEREDLDLYKNALTLL